MDDEVLTFREFPDLWASIIRASIVKFRRNSSSSLFRRNGQCVKLQGLVESAVKSQQDQRTSSTQQNCVSTLAKLDLSCCKRIDLTLVPGLTSLNLSSHCEVATSVAVLLKHVPKLTELDLGECREISELELLEALPLQRLSLRCLQAPKRFPRSLTSLNLELATVTDWEFLSTLPQLTTLNLSNCESVTDAVIQLLHALRLHELILVGNNNINDTTIAQLAASLCGQSLRTINLQACGQLTDASVASLAQMSSLETVSLEWNTEITDQGIHQLHKLHSLKTLYLGDCEQLSVEGLRALSPGLERLNLGGTVPAVDVAALVRFSNLRALHLDSTAVTAQGLDYLPALSRLQRLGLVGCRNVNDECLVVLSRISGLTALDLSHTAIRGVRSKELTLASLSKLVFLRELMLSLTDIDDRALEGLVMAQSLRVLHLSDTRVTSAGLKHLMGLPRLNRVHLGGCRIHMLHPGEEGTPEEMALTRWIQDRTTTRVGFVCM